MNTIKAIVKAVGLGILGGLLFGAFAIVAWVFVIGWAFTEEGSPSLIEVFIVASSLSFVFIFFKEYKSISGDR